ncbi:MAG: 16S rRNA (guanine(527)-N(7))-methyltransferase RsmG [Pirellulales bacterium]|nr:16S rRNA (guanine(527)-N(7))-methyltransferase RsmG [Pirellulales bacterium]
MSDENSTGEDLNAVLVRHAIALPPEQVEQLDRYCQLLWEWNEKLNLTRHTSYEKFVARDLADTLQLAKLMEQHEAVLDVGTGGGVPGIPLRIVRDDLQVALIDSVGKKARAVEDIVRRLPLPINVHAERLQDHLPRRRYDTLVVRAVARLEKLLEWVKPHWGSFRRMLVIKGPAWVEERGEARHRGLMNDLDLRKLAEYPLHGTDSQSVILQLSRRSAS